MIEKINPKKWWYMYRVFFWTLVYWKCNKRVNHDYRNYYNLLALFALESGWFSNTLTESWNNFASMGRASVRPNCQSGVTEDGPAGNQNEPKEFATYRSIRLCVKDWFMWLDYQGEGPIDGFDFFEYLKQRGYYAISAQKYQEGISSVMPYVAQWSDQFIVVTSVFSMSLSAAMIAAKTNGKWKHQIFKRKTVQK